MKQAPEIHPDDFKTIAAEIPFVKAFHDYYLEYGTERAHGLLAGLILFRETLDAEKATKQ